MSCLRADQPHSRMRSRDCFQPCITFLEFLFDDFLAPSWNSFWSLLEPKSTSKMEPFHTPCLDFSENLGTMILETRHRFQAGRRRQNGSLLESIFELIHAELGRGKLESLKNIVWPAQKASCFQAKVKLVPWFAPGTSATHFALQP